MHTNIEIFEIIIFSVRTNALKKYHHHHQCQKNMQLTVRRFHVDLYSMFVAVIQRFPSIHQ